MNSARAILFKLTSVALFVVMSAMIKAVSDTVPAGEAVFFRSLFAIPVILVWLIIRGELSIGLRTVDPMGHLWRGLAGVTAMALMFTGLGLLPLPEVTAIGYATPIMVVVFAAMFLGERVRLFRIMSVGLGLIGVLIILSPRLGAFSDPQADARTTLGAVVVLAGAVMAALAQVFVRKMVQTEQPSAIVFWFSVTSTVLSLATIPFGWVVPTAEQAPLLIGAGLLGGVAQIFLTLAYRNAHASVVAPFDYSSMLFSLVIGYLVFSEVPTMTMLSGAALVIGAGILIIWRERQLGLERGQAKRSVTPQG